MTLTKTVSLAALDAYAGELSARDDDVLARCRDENPWGVATAIDLADCSAAAIGDAGHIGRFVVALCDAIEMRRFGDPIIVRFGADPRVSGYSLAQLIETSLVSGHFAEESGAAYIDIFSCKPYRPYLAARLCAHWFEASGARVSVTMRLAEQVAQARQ